MSFYFKNIIFEHFIIAIFDSILAITQYLDLSLKNKKHGFVAKIKAKKVTETRKKMSDTFLKLWVLQSTKIFFTPAFQKC